MRRLALLRDPNVAQIVAACTQDEPLCVLSEFSDYGDLCHFLKSHQPHNLSHYSNTNDLNTSLSSGSSGIVCNCLATLSRAILALTSL